MPRKATPKKPATSVVKAVGAGEGGRLKTPNLLINGVNIKDLCKWVPDEDRQQDFLTENGTLTQAAPHLINTAKEDTFLWLPLVDHAMPSWLRGAQGIGDCVSWGAELCATMQMAIQHVLGQGRFIAPAATEAIYGGCRVEALGKSRGGRSDGAAGNWAAKWLRDWGAILRVDYSKETGNAEHDLRTYSKTKAKEWGDYGCGGAKDNAALDGAARVMPVQHVVQIRTLDEAVAAILNGYTISVASSAGYGDMERDANGVCRIRGTWQHQMMWGGVRFRAGEPQLRNFQSWGKSCSGADPGVKHRVVSDCSWWVVPEDAEWVLRSGDCWAFSDVMGMPKRKIDLARAVSTWHSDDKKTKHRYSLGA